MISDSRLQFGLVPLILGLTVGVKTVDSSLSAADEEAMHALSPREQIIRQFKTFDMYYTGGRYHREKFSYRLYVTPQRADATKRPLILWFHGYGESGNDNFKNLTHIDVAVARFTRENGPFPGYILVPQVPEGESWFSSGNAKQDDMLTIAWTMLQRTMGEYPIDEDRIAIAGVSSGGSACWEMGMRHPGRFAAIVPLSSRGGDESRAATLAGTPIWAFHNLHDKHASIEGARRMVDAIRGAGGLAKLTEISNVGHAAWEPAFRDFDVLDWLLARRRNESSLKLSLQFLDWQRIGLQTAVITMIAALCLIELQRRKRRKKCCRLNSRILPQKGKLAM